MLPKEMKEESQTITEQEQLDDITRLQELLELAIKVAVIQYCLKSTISISSFGVIDPARLRLEFDTVQTDFAAIQEWLAIETQGNIEEIDKKIAETKELLELEESTNSTTIPYSEGNSDIELAIYLMILKGELSSFNGCKAQLLANNQLKMLFAKKLSLGLSPTRAILQQLNAEPIPTIAIDSAELSESIQGIQSLIDAISSYIPMAVNARQMQEFINKYEHMKRELQLLQKINKLQQLRQEIVNLPTLIKSDPELIQSSIIELESMINLEILNGQTTPKAGVDTTESSSQISNAKEITVKQRKGNSGLAMIYALYRAEQAKLIKAEVVECIADSRGCCGQIKPLCK